MGLGNREQSGPGKAHWLLPMGLVLAALMIAAAGLDEAARYESTWRSSGEFYRLLTGHLAHLGWQHLLLNLAGLGLVWMLVGSLYTLREWLLISIASIIAMDVAFVVWMPGLEWYVGLSGLLHGLLAGGLPRYVASRRPEAYVLAVGVTLKLMYEVAVGPLPGSESAAGGSVITEAHLFGAIGGLIAGLYFVLTKRQRLEGE